MVAVGDGRGWVVGVDGGGGGGGVEIRRSSGGCRLNTGRESTQHTKKENPTKQLSRTLCWSYPKLTILP